MRARFTVSTTRRQWLQAAVAVAGGLLAFPALALDGLEILKKVDRNLEPESSESLRKLIYSRGL